MRIEDFKRLKEIYFEIRNLLEEAKAIIRSDNPREWERSKSTWYGNIAAALGGMEYDEHYATMLKIVHGTFDICCDEIDLIETDTGHACLSCDHVFEEEEEEEEEESEVEDE